MDLTECSRDPDIGLSWRCYRVQGVASRSVSDLIVVRGILEEPLLLYLCNVTYERFVTCLEDLMKDHILGFAVLRVKLAFT